MPDNIQEINFEKLIHDAIGKKQFRLAVRLSYLLLLKELSIKDLIAWSPEKTNYEYLKEIKSNDIRDQFAQNSLMYEYVWYGDFEIDQDNASKVLAAFQAFTRQIKEQR
jgi:archaellum biogenesis ATPase FlaH